MEKILGEIMQMAKQQGFSIALLVLAVWWMNGENNELEEKVDLCNQTLIESYQENNAHIIEVLNDNTDIMNDFCHYLREVKEEKK